MRKYRASLSFYGGVDEIGGNKILLKEKDTRILFDFGMSFSEKSKFYAPPFLSPRSEASLRELGILPKLDGVYCSDEGESQIDAVFLSHGHLDHSGHLSFIKRDIPIYTGETTRSILETLSETRRTDLEFNMSDLMLKTFRTGDKIRIDSVEVEPIHVDHSIPGAYGFIIYTSEGAVVYTGDFRRHGSKSDMTTDFVEKAKESEPIALVTEATNLTGASVSSEGEVEEKLKGIVGASEGIVLSEFAFADVDRLNSFYRVAEKSERCLAVSLRQAHLLSRLESDRHLTVPKLDDDNILIFRKSKKQYANWEKRILEDHQDKVVDVFELSKRQCSTILATSFYDLEELVDLKPEAGSCYVLSSSEPFNEEMEIDYEKLVNWLSHYGLPQYHIHVSGHIMPQQLKDVINRLVLGKRSQFTLSIRTCLHVTCGTLRPL
jgi:ribonuclease J